MRQITVVMDSEILPEPQNKNETGKSIIYEKISLEKRKDQGKLTTITSLCLHYRLPLFELIC